MINPLTAKVKMYFGIGVAIIFAALVTVISVQTLRHNAVVAENNILKISGDVADKKVMVMQTNITIVSNFAASSGVAIDKITNEITFTPEKQDAIDKIQGMFKEVRSVEKCKQ